MTSLKTASYKNAFNHLLHEVTLAHPEFNNGSDIRAWVVDFSEAQAKALESQNCQAIRGCFVHFLRASFKIADKVCEDDEEKGLFIKIVKAIPEVKEPKHVSVLFNALCGKTSLNEIPEEVLKISKQEHSLKCKSWKKANRWVEWWLRPRHTKMICLSMTEMSKVDWTMCPSTTNGVEAQNRVSSLSSASLRAQLEHIYREDTTNMCVYQCCMLYGQSGPWMEITLSVSLIFYKTIVGMVNVCSIIKELIIFVSIQNCINPHNKVMGNATMLTGN